jgi:hypothetical protein
MERFWSKVKKGDDCWEWIGAKRRNGYGCFKFRGHLVGAHRVAYILAVGEIPENFIVLHSCDNRGCVNPAHLSAGTHTDNTQDAIQKKRHHFPPGSGKLTLEDAREIRKLYADTGQYAWIARRYGLDKKTVRQVILGEIWHDRDTDIDTLTGDSNRQLAA